MVEANPSYRTLDIIYILVYSYIEMSDITRHVIQLGGSLLVTLPAAVVDAWGLEKGSEVRVEITPQAVRITPIQVARLEQVEEADFARLIDVMQEIEMKAWVEDDGAAVRIEFSGGSPEVVRSLSHNLVKFLPAALSVLGLRPAPNK